MSSANSVRASRPTIRLTARILVTTVVIFVITLASGVACAERQAMSDPETSARTAATVSTTSAPTGDKASQPAPLSQSAPPPGARPRDIVVIGDSYTGGSAAGGVGPANWTSLVWSDLTLDGIAVTPEVSGKGGSGYVQVGTEGTVFGGEAARLVRPEDDVVVFFGGANDGPQRPEAVAAAARADFAAVRTTAPGAVLLVIGPAWLSTYPEELLRARDAIRAEAIAAGATFVDPLAEEWFSGTPAQFIGADRIHPTDAGHAYLAQRIEPHIRDAISAARAG